MDLSSLRPCAYRPVNILTTDRLTAVSISELPGSLVWPWTSTSLGITTTSLFSSSSLGTCLVDVTDGRYFLFELPSNLVIRRIGPGNWLAFIIICWGAISIGMGFSPNWQILSVTRALLGVFEAGFFPGCVYLISCWYKRYEVQTRLAFFYMASVFTSGFSVHSFSLVLIIVYSSVRLVTDPNR